MKISHLYFNHFILLSREKKRKGFTLSGMEIFPYFHYKRPEKTAPLSMAAYSHLLHITIKVGRLQDREQQADMLMQLVHINGCE